MSLFDRILVPLDRSSLAECVLPHAVALSHCLGSQVVLFRIVSLLESQDRLRCLPALCYQSRPALPHLTLGKPCRPGDRSQPREEKRVLTSGAKKHIMPTDICLTVVSQVGILSGTLVAHRRRSNARCSHSFIVQDIADTQPYPNPTGLNGKAAQPSPGFSRGRYGKGGLC